MCYSVRTKRREQEISLFQPVILSMTRGLIRIVEVR